MHPDGPPEIVGFDRLEPIGAGGFSVVYRAEQLGLGRSVALKVFNVNGSEARRLEREAAALGELSDVDNVVQVHQITSTTDGRPVIVMAVMESSLGEVIRSADPPVDDQLALRWLDQVALALDTAHARAIYHRDVKPENILLDRSGSAHLADFGIAALSSMESSTTTSFSFSPPYAAPERLTGEEADPIRSDVYSLGASFYAVLSGAAPFGSSTQGGVHGLISRVVTQPLEPRGRVTGEVFEVFQQVMAKDPSARHASAREFAERLRGAVVQGDAPAPSPGASGSDEVGPHPTTTPEWHSSGATVAPTSEQIPSAGWFQDPDGMAAWRWWSGTAWTEDRVAFDAGSAPVPSSDQTPALSPEPGWYPDPVGRHEFRYWSGTEWTPQVSSGGVSGFDPVV